MPGVGFEPTHPEITELKSAALDHSAIQAHIIIIIIYIYSIHDSRGIRTPAGGHLPDFESGALNHSAILS